MYLDCSCACRQRSTDKERHDGIPLLLLCRILVDRARPYVHQRNKQLVRVHVLNAQRASQASAPNESSRLRGPHAHVPLGPPHHFVASTLDEAACFAQGELVGYRVFRLAQHVDHVAELRRAVVIVVVWLDAHGGAPAVSRVRNTGVTT